MELNSVWLGGFLSTEMVFYHNYGPVKERQIDSDSVGITEEEKKKENETLAKFALCYYIASADGIISSEETGLIDGAIDEICSNEYISSDFRRELNKVKTNGQNPSVLIAYLDKVDNETISSFSGVLEDIANSDNQISDAEKEAIEAVKAYVSERSEAGVAVNNNLIKCESCGFEFDKTAEDVVRDGDIYCPQCGAVQIL